jgi:hypothetical protein
LRAGARCTSCGSKGATVQRPGWAGNNVGFYPFPTNIADDFGSSIVDQMYEESPCGRELAFYSLARV